jgi:hypothetical protein
MILTPEAFAAYVASEAEKWAKARVVHYSTT